MSTLRVTIEQLTVEPHPNADRLELAQVGLYRAVVPKGVYQTGEWALYIPEQAVLPPALIDELGLTGKLAGSNKDRVKAVKLRGALSQGIVCRPAAVQNFLGPNYAWKHPVADSELVAAGTELAVPSMTYFDFSDLLGITKWEPPIPTQMAGKVSAAPDLIRWVEIENIKRYPDIFAAGEPVVATEKIHGTCMLVTYVPGRDEFYVSSKGFGKKNLALAEDAGNLYWRAVKDHNLRQLAEALSGFFPQAESIGIFGEVYGAGVQDLGYGVNANQGAPGYAIFDIAVRCEGSTSWLTRAEVEEALHLVQRKRGISANVVPVLYDGPYDVEKLTRLAEGKTLVGGDNIREGLVVRPRLVETTSPVTGGRKIAKFVSDAYLTRGGNATEFE